MISSKQTYWQSIINEQAQSGLTKTKFCQQHNLNITTFYYWLKKLRGESEDETVDKAQAVLPILLLETAEGAPIEVLLPRGVRLFFPCNLSQEQIRHWLGALS